MPPIIAGVPIRRVRQTTWHDIQAGILKQEKFVQARNARLPAELQKTIPPRQTHCQLQFIAGRLPTKQHNILFIKLILKWHRSCCE
jgi:hypothetical protein